MLRTDACKCQKIDELGTRKRRRNAPEEQATDEQRCVTNTIRRAKREAGNRRFGPIGMQRQCAAAAVVREGISSGASAVSMTKQDNANHSVIHESNAFSVIAEKTTSRPTQATAGIPHQSVVGIGQKLAQ